jgi:hypothetical protein
MAIPSPAVGQYVRCIVESFHSPSSQIGMNRVDFVVESVVGGGLTIGQIASQMLAVVQGVFPAANATTVFLSGVVSELLTTATGKVAQTGQAIDNITVGSAGVGVAPSQVAPVLKKFTGLAGRKNRGRSYFPFLFTGFLQANGELTGAGLTALTTYYSAIFQAQTLVVGGATTVLVPVLLGKAVPLVGIDLTSIQMSGLLGTQRRRGDYGRQNPAL